MASSEVGQLKIALSFDEKKFDDSIDEIEQKTDGVGEKITAVGGKIAKTFAAAVAAAGAAIGKLTADATKLYADYEQIAGGVETLFKDSADTVMNYASKAYETAGMSANDYMENVTSFTASLLQSLGGDTAKAAEIANQTLIDMSDNANKMGTDIERITDAYQGFAKQNYTMLDNLKLGYGGTKGEMERLLADATKLSGIEYSIDSLNDVFEAIHIIQGELDITGTTALEASTTVSGSLNQMKSAWKNLLTFMGGGTHMAWNEIFPAFTESVKTFATNILPVIHDVLFNVGGLIADLTPIIIDELPELVEDLLPLLLNTATELVIGLTEALPDLVTTLIEAIVEVLPNLLDGILTALPTILQAIVDGIMQIALLLTEPQNLQMLLDAAVQLLMAIVNALPQILEALSQALPKIVANITSFLLDPTNLMLIIVAAVELFMGLVKAIPQVVVTLMGSLGALVDEVLRAIDSWIGPLVGAALKTAGEFVGTIIGVIGELPGKMLEIGGNIVHGIWEGISGAASWLWDKITGFCDGIFGGILEFFGIHSPSRLFRDEVGAMLAEGIGVGFTVEMEDVTQEMTAAIPTPASDDMGAWDRAIDGILAEDESESSRDGNSGVTITQYNEINSNFDIDQMNDALLQEIRMVA